METQRPCGVCLGLGPRGRLLRAGPRGSVDVQVGEAGEAWESHSAPTGPHVAQPHAGTLKTRASEGVTFLRGKVWGREGLHRVCF